MFGKNRDESAAGGTDELSSLLHDIRNCLHALRIGRELLQQMHPEDELNDICSAMQSEERKAFQLLDRLTSVVRGAGADWPAGE